MTDLLSQINLLRKLYADDTNKERLRLLLYGDKGHGKTSACLTARRPIYIQSFDPGGTLLPEARKAVDAGWLVVDTRWEGLSLKSPDVFPQWLTHMKELESLHLFDFIGTFVLDSLTFWSSFVMAYITATHTDRTKGKVLIGDYVPFQMEVVNQMKGFHDLPCDVIVTAHIAKVPDAITGAMKTSLNLTGVKTAGRVIAAFPELWVARKVFKAGQKQFAIMTDSDSLYEASTRIGSGVFNQYEQPNITAMLDKLGWDTSERKVK